MSARSSLCCLGCGYDLRAAGRGGEGTIVCPECGRENDPWILRRQGASRGAPVRLILLILAPAAMLLGSTWSFSALTGESLLSLLCILLAPAVIIVHGYTVWSYVSAKFILRPPHRRRLEWAAVALAIVIDIGACAAVIKVLM